MNNPQLKEILTPSFLPTSLQVLNPERIKKIKKFLELSLFYQSVLEYDSKVSYLKTNMLLYSRKIKELKKDVNFQENN